MCKPKPELPKSNSKPPPAPWSGPLVVAVIDDIDKLVETMQKEYQERYEKNSNTGQDYTFEAYHYGNGLLEMYKHLIKNPKS